MTIFPVAYMKSDFPTKFGLPRQSGLIDTLTSYVVFEKQYAVPEALRGLEGFTHIYLIWGFSEIKHEGWSPTVRPPRLGGNTRMGVFATRSPYRPNPLGLSCVRLRRIIRDGGSSILEVTGADLMDGTPIYDIKPYLPFTDCHPDATGGFADMVREDRLTAEIPDELLAKLPEDKRAALFDILRSDPRPSYHDDPARIYGFPYAGFEIQFHVDGSHVIVCNIQEVSH